MGDARKWRAILLFGLPGSGKGTQGKALGSMPGYLHVASGEIFRQLSRFGQLGKQVSSYTNEGKLVPDELTVDIWRNHMTVMLKDGLFNPADQVIILDGIPRTYKQTQLLQEDIEVLQVFFLKLKDEEALRRMKARAAKEKRVDDGSDAVMRGRLETFYRETRETLDGYDSSLVDEIDATGKPMRILSELACKICKKVDGC